MDWVHSDAGRCYDTLDCIALENNPAAPSGHHRTSFCPGSTWHMTPKGRPPTSTPWRVSGTDGRKFWRLYRTSGLKRRRVAATATCAGWWPTEPGASWRHRPRPRPSRVPSSNNPLPLARMFTSPPAAPRLTELFNWSIHFSCPLPFHASTSERLTNGPWRDGHNP